MFDIPDSAIPSPKYRNTNLHISFIFFKDSLRVLSNLDAIDSFSRSDFDCDAHELAAQVRKYYKNTNNETIVDNKLTKHVAHIGPSRSDGGVQSNVKGDDDCAKVKPDKSEATKTAKILVSKTKTKTGLPLLLKSSLK